MPAFVILCAFISRPKLSLFLQILMNAVNSAEFVNMVHVETLQELIYATVTRVMNAVTMENDVKVKIHEICQIP